MSSEAGMAQQCLEISYHKQKKCFEMVLYDVF